MNDSKQFSKIIALILVIVMSFSIFAGCTPNTNGGDTGNNGQNNSGNNDNNDNKDDVGGDTSEEPSDDTHTCAFGEWVIVKAPTNSEDGLQERKCECGAVEQKVIKASGGDYAIHYNNLKTAEYPETTGYNSSEGLLSLPKPVAEGYIFIGWFTKSIGGDIVDYIPKDSTKDYVLYAHWDLVTYDITYKNVPNNTNPTTYNIESKLKLKSPEWSGLEFDYWSDEDGNKYIPDINITAMPENMSGDLILTANWKTRRNLATPARGDQEINVGFSSEDGYVFFHYYLGTIEHVILDSNDEISNNLYYKSEGMPISYTLSKTVTIGEETSKTISNTISESVSKSVATENSYNFASNQSTNWSEQLSSSVGAEIGTEADYGVAKVSASITASIETNIGVGGSSGTSSGWGSSVSTQNETSTENSKTVSSSLAYMEEISTTTEETIHVPADQPSGYYAYVHAGNIEVNAVVIYEIATGCLYINTYSYLDNMHSMVMYYPDVNSLNNPAIDGLDFTIPKETIINKIESSYYVKYDANGGEGTMPITMHSVDGNEKLATNTFTNSGKIFVGWQYETDDGIQILLDGQSVTNLGSALETVTLKALWEGDPDLDVIYDLKTVTGTYDSEPKITYSALIQYRNRTEDSVEIRVIWTATKHSGYNYHAQNVKFTVGNVTSGKVEIVPEGDWEKGYSSRTAESPWFTVSLDSADATSIGLKVYYWQTTNGGKTVVNVKINQTWTITIPACK